jgi:hypothetical protein
MIGAPLSTVMSRTFGRPPPGRSACRAPTTSNAASSGCRRTVTSSMLIEIGRFAQQPPQTESANRAKVDDWIGILESW